MNLDFLKKFISNIKSPIFYFQAEHYSNIGLFCIFSEFIFSYILRRINIHNYGQYI